MHCGYHQVNKHRILRNEMYKENQMWRASERERGQKHVINQMARLQNKQQAHHLIAHT